MWIVKLFLLLAQTTHLFLLTCVLPHTPTGGVTRIFSLTPMLQLGMERTSVQLHLFKGPYLRTLNQHSYHSLGRIEKIVKDCKVSYKQNEFVNVWTLIQSYEPLGLASYVNEIFQDGGAPAQQCVFRYVIHLPFKNAIFRGVEKRSQVLMIEVCCAEMRDGDKFLQQKKFSTFLRENVKSAQNIFGGNAAWH